MLSIEVTQGFFFQEQSHSQFILLGFSVLWDNLGNGEFVGFSQFCV